MWRSRGSTKVDIAQAAVTASAKRVGYHATGTESSGVTTSSETSSETATPKSSETTAPKSSETTTPSEGSSETTGGQGTGSDQNGTPGDKTDGTETKPDDTKPDKYEITIVHMFYKNDGKTKADKKERMRMTANS